MKYSTIAAVVLTVLPVTIIPGTAAHAVPPPAEKHCVMNLDTGLTACRQDEGSARTATSADSTAASYNLLRIYDGTGYTGSSLLYAYSRPCTSSLTDIDYVDPSFDNAFWNNRISSVKTYNYCDVKFYDGTKYGGASSVWIDASSNLAQIGSGWSNRASSLKIS